MTSRPFNIKLLCLDKFENSVSDKSEKIPFFLLPYGFQCLSLFQIAQYYDQSATAFFNSFIFTNNNSFHSFDTIDYSEYFTQIQTYQIPQSTTPNELIECSDRFLNYNFILSLNPLGSTSYLSFHVPKGKENSIVHLLSYSRDFSRLHLFSLMAVPFDSIPLNVLISIGQPFFFNSFMEKYYSNYDSISARQETIQNEIKEMHENHFQLDWAIVSIDGQLNLILVRPPQFIRIADGVLASFDSIEEAFQYSHLYFVCYRHSSFDYKKSFELSTNFNDKNTAIKSDEIFCNLITAKISGLKISNFTDYLVNSIRYPSFFLQNCGFDHNISMAASIFIDNSKGRASSFFFEQIEQEPAEGAPAPVNDLFHTSNTTETKIHLEKIQIATKEYHKLLFWFRSLTDLLKSVHKKDLNKITEYSLTCFRSIPIRNRFIISSTIMIVIDVLNYVRKLKGQTDDFFKSILRVFHCVFGDDFDSVLGLQKWEVPRALRNQVINVDGCVKLFYIREIEIKKKTITNAINRFMKFWSLVQKEIQIDRKIADFKLSPSFIEFLKLQNFDRSIEI